MRRWAAAVLVALAVAGACTRGDDEAQAAEELAEIAIAADSLEYQATYRYTLSGPLAPAVQTEMVLVQQPPSSLRRIETVTLGEDGERHSITQWLADREDGSYACAEYTEGLQCMRRAGPTGVFGHAQVDEIFRAVRDPESLESVERIDDTRIAGEQARCYAVTPPETEPEPARTPEPQFNPTRFELEICYSADGILLRARRTIVGDVPADLEERTESLLEASSVTREVTPADIALPGPIRGEDED